MVTIFHCISDTEFSKIDIIASDAISFADLDHYHIKRCSIPGSCGQVNPQ